MFPPTDIVEVALPLIFPLAVMFPAKSKLSLKSIPLPPVADWKESANTVPLALMSPLAVMLVVTSKPFLTLKFLT